VVQGAVCGAFFKAIIPNISCIGKKAILIPRQPSNGLYIGLSSRLYVVATPNLTLNLHRKDKDNVIGYNM
jgi:hypothetical protein